MIKNIEKIIKKQNFFLKEDEIKNQALQYYGEIDSNNYDFSSAKKQVFTQIKKKRIIYNFDKESTEDILCRYMKSRLDSLFKVKYPSRKRIINSLFNTFPIVKDLNDFVIVRADFKSFFDSVLSTYVYANYIKKSALSRKDKRYFEEYVKEFKFCYAGLCLSNVLTEIICQEFDNNILSEFDCYGVVYYERYVDDMLIIMNSYISKDKFLETINNLIEKTFENCPVKLNMDKFCYIAKRDIGNDQSFNFLGYNFTIKFDLSKKQHLEFKFGIAEKKRKRYYSLFKQAFLDYKKNNNEELLRQRVKLFSTRIVITRAFGNNINNWITKSIVANYNELRYHTDNLEKDTESFLKNVYADIADELKMQHPHFIKIPYGQEESAYNLLSTMKRNRSLIFDNNIGIRKRDMVNLIKKLDPEYSPGSKNYYQITMDYFDIIKK